MTMDWFGYVEFNADATLDSVLFAEFFNVALPELKSKSLATVSAKFLSRSSTSTPAMF